MNKLNDALGSLARQLQERHSDDAETTITLTVERAMALFETHDRDTALLRQALEALEYYLQQNTEWKYAARQTIDALRERLAR